MSEFLPKLLALENFQANAQIRIETLGNFCVWRNHEKIDSKEWGRDKTIQLLQYLISNRQRNALHKEKIIDGRIKKFVSERALLEQEFFLDPEMTVGEVIKASSGKLGENMTLSDFVRLDLA